jgi:alanine-synthesizing transaminase
MRHRILKEGADELTYEIRGIVKKADLLQKMGRTISWENIGDPIEKNAKLPEWMRQIVSDTVTESKSYGYCNSKGVLATREFLAEQNNNLGGVQITADDILFFNGLGDAIATIYNLLDSNARVIGPSPAYSTHSSAEASHADDAPLTYNLDPENNWFPDLGDLYLKVKYNPNIVGILIINPDNPTGMVYPEESLRRVIEIAKEFNLFVLADEIYTNITYNGAQAIPLAQIVDDVPAISMKGISKEFPWPGSRCGWMEYYNIDASEEFRSFCNALDNAKMIEVCSTTLPQLVIPKVMKDPRYQPYLQSRRDAIGKRSERLTQILSDVPGILVNQTYGAFYNTIIFKDGVLNPHQFLEIDQDNIRLQIEEWVKGVKPDYRFVYYLLGAEGICVVPASSFCSELQGFRVTLLEEDAEKFEDTFMRLRNALLHFIASA